MNAFGTRARRWCASLGLAVLVLGLLGPGAAASDRPLDRIARSEVSASVRLMIQLQGSPLAERDTPQQRTLIGMEQSGFRNQLRQAGIAFRELSAYQKLFNGLAVQVDAKEISRIAGLKGVTGVFRSEPVKMDLGSSVKMIGADQAWRGDQQRGIPGVDGTGITVAVIDTGIDYTHPDLGGCFGSGCRVVDGFDFVGKNFPKEPNKRGSHVETWLPFAYWYIATRCN